jgi:tripartite-type tricarboxylate transporter receptor subunit TctC
MADGGKARVLATFTQAPLPMFKGAPTVEAATGLKGLQVPVWVGLMAPAATPPAVLERLGTEVLAVCRLPETQERFKALGAVSACAGRAELARVVAEDSERWGRVIRSAGIKAD